MIRLPVLDISTGRFTNILVKIDSPYKYCNCQIRQFFKKKKKSPTDFERIKVATKHNICLSVSCTEPSFVVSIVTCHMSSIFRDKWCLRHHCFRQRKVPNICQRKSNWSGGLVWTVRVVSDFQRPLAPLSSLLSLLSIIITLGTFFNFDLSSSVI